MAILFPISFKSADNLAEAASGTPKQSTLTYNATSSTASVSLSLNGTSASSGTFATSDNNQKAVFSLSTDNYTGYILRLKTAGATTLTNGTNTINAIESDGITSSSFGVNRWGLLPSKYNCTTSTCPENTTTYYQPTTTGFIMEQTSSANSTAKEYKVGLGLKADYNTPAGTYTSSAIVAEYVARPISYSITYDKGNISGTPSNIPAAQSDLISSTSVDLSSTAPSIANYTFTGWCMGTVSTNTTTHVDSCTGTNAKTFQAGASFGIDQTTSNDVTLHAMWSAIPRTVTVTAGAGVSTLTLSGWTGTGTAAMTKTYYTGDTINLSTITPTYKTAYSGVAYTKTDSATGSSISGSTYTVGSGNGAITIKATTLAQPTCTIQGGATKVYNRSATTLTATDNSENYDTSSVNITYSFGYASNGTNDLASFSTAQTGTTLSIPAAAFRGARYYGVTVVVTDKTDSSITNTCTSGTVDAAVTGTNVDNRTTMTLVNSRINFNATTNGGTLSGTSPVYVYYKGTATYSSRTGSTARAIPTATKSGYNFTGWWTAASGGSKVINADGTLTGVAVSGWTNASKQWIKTGTSNSSTATANQLYAQFELACDSTAFSGYMQDITTAMVTNANVCDSGTLTDRRDNKTYKVTKLADNKLWMTENLAIDLTATSYDTLYGTGTNAGKMTNATSQALKYLKGTATGTASDQWAMAAVKKTWTSSNSYSQPWIAVDSSTSGVCNNAHCVNSDKSWSSTSVTSQTINSMTSIAQGKIGVYYNYCAASAGSYCWGNGTSYTGSPSSDPNTSSLRDITSDICPYGWRLPTGGSSGEFQALYTAYSSNATNFVTALSTPLSGYFDGGKAYYQGYYGLFWASTWDTDRYMSRLMLYSPSVSSSVVSDNSSIRYSGLSVRCVFDPPTMQDTAVADLSEGEAKGVVDARDGKDYTIKKINGLLWMTQNLRFTGTSVPSATSNVTSDKTLTYYSLKDNASSSSTKCYGTSSSGNGYSNACIQDSGSTSTGVWYNYYAATAGTVSGTSNSTAASQDICPKNWHLPTGPNTTANTDFNKLVGNTTSGWQNPTAGFTAFGAVAGGVYDNGSLYSTGNGYWWSATARDTTYRYLLLYTSSDGQFRGDYHNSRYLGLFVRCVRSS